MLAFGRMGLSAILLIGMSGSALPQTKGAAAPAPISPEPKTTTATYGDWTLRCEMTSGDKPRRVCEVVETLQVQGQQAPVAQVALGRPEGSGELHLIAVLPVNVSFPSAVRVAADDKDPHPVDLQWRRCLPGGCFSDAVANDEALGRWRAAATPGRLQFKDGAGREVVLPLSFRGLAQALDGLGKQ